MLVHGAFADGSSYAEVIPHLTRAGLKATEVQNPLTSFADDVAATRRALARHGGPVLLVGHSYGGLVARSFANRYPDDVAGMVLVDSFSPELRESMGDNWPAWVRWNAPADAIIADYPDYERVDFDKALAGAAAIAFLVGVLTVPLQPDVDILERPLDELAHLRGLAGGEHEVVRLILLQDHPHAAHIVAGVTPIALGIEIAEVEPFLPAELDRRHTARDLAGDEGFAA